MPKIWVGRTTLNGEKKKDSLTDSKRVIYKRHSQREQTSSCQNFFLLFITAAPAEFNRDFLGEPTITHYQPDQHSAEVALKCEVQVNDFIRSWTNVTYQITWYSEGKHLKTDNSICARLPAPPLGSTIIPDYDSPCLNNGRPLFSRLEGMEYKLNRLVC